MFSRKINNIIFLKKMMIFSVPVVISFFVFFEFFSSNFGIWFDDLEHRCIPEYSFYFVIKGSPILKRGEIGTFKTHKAIKFFPLGSDFGKYVAGVAGDKVDINKDGVYINGVLVASGFMRNAKFTSDVSSLYKKYVIDEGHYFFIGVGSNSYDSRYWGTVKQEQITGRAWGLW